MNVPFVEIFSIAAAGFPIHSTFTSDVAVLSSSVLSSVFSLSSVLASLKAGSSSSFVDCCSASVWALKRPRSPSLLRKTSPLLFEVVLLCVGRCGLPLAYSSVYAPIWRCTTPGGLLGGFNLVLLSFPYFPFSSVYFSARSPRVGISRRDATATPMIRWLS